MLTETTTSSATTAAERARINWGFVATMTIVHLGALVGVLFFSTWVALALMLSLVVAFGWVGICMCYHRLLAHGSYKVEPWFERVLITIGALNLQGGPISWVATHIQHHAKSDKPGDPHSPVLGGFWHAHLGWMLRGGQKLYAFAAVDRLKAVRYYRFLELGQIFLQAPLAVVLYALGGWPFVFYGIFVRIAFIWHITFSINSVCHVWGSRRYETRDDSRNNWLVSVLAGGEGLHNNHHYDPKAASNRRGAWDFDPTWWMIRGLAWLGLATEVQPQKKAN